MNIKKNIYHYLLWNGRYHLICNKEITYIDNELRKKINLNKYMLRIDPENHKNPKTIEEFVGVGAWGHILSYDTFITDRVSIQKPWDLTDHIINEILLLINSDTNMITLSNGSLDEIKCKLETFIE